MRIKQRLSDRIAAAVLGTMGFALVGCQNLEIHTPNYSPATVSMKVVEAKYSQVGDHCYVNVLALQAGLQGWKEKYLSRDGLLDAQIVLRIPAVAVERNWSNRGDLLDGYVFLGSALGRVAAWRVVTGRATTIVGSAGPQISLEVEVEPIYPEERARRRLQGHVPDTLVLKKVELQSDSRVPSLILAAKNTRIVPALRQWEGRSAGDNLR